MEAEEDDTMMGAKERIKELENMVAALTVKITMVEAKNSMLVKSLATLEERLKLISCQEINREQISSGDRNEIIQGSCQENVWRSNNSPVTPDNMETGVEIQTCVTDKQSYWLSKTPLSGELVTKQHGGESANEAICGVKRNTTVGMQLGFQSPQSASFTTEGGLTGKQVEQVSRMVKKGRSLQNQITRHVALKIMYIGSSYHGFASQGVSHKTVESELFAALEHTKLLIGDRVEANYSRCGRTDKGVSAIGQLIALQLRSKLKTPATMSFHGDEAHVELLKDDLADIDVKGPSWDRVAAARASRSFEESASSTIGAEDEIDYVGVLNRVLPEDIRVLGWCPVPRDFNARFSCLYREYKYFFINENLDLDAMKLACSKFLGDHDFRNFCKMDAANVHNYRRTISIFEILPVNESWAGKKVWVMRIRGTAFLWHQIRCMAAVLFMVGQGHESPTIVEDLLDVRNVTRKPQYIMASELPLVLHTCGFKGLTLHCSPRAARHLHMHLNDVMEQMLLQLALLHEAMLELPILDGADVEKHSTPRKQYAPLLLRLSEPSYEERRGRKNARAI